MDDTSQITALIHGYAERIDAGDLDGVAALFADATWRSPGRAEPLRGAAAVRRAYDGVILYDGIPCTKHVVTNVVVAIDRDAATARSYFTVFQARPDLPLQPIIAGRYHDAFVRVGGAWRFADRLIIPDLVGDLRRHLRVSIPQERLGVLRPRSASVRRRIATVSTDAQRGGAARPARPRRRSRRDTGT